MKFACALLGIIGVVTSGLCAAEAPPISARKALDIAEESLRDRGLTEKIFVAGVRLERSSVVGGYKFWFVKWSESLPASDPRNREVGVKVYMDGRAVRLVKEPGTP
jgi:hypothetical protein